jgi:cell division initiation protein
MKLTPIDVKSQQFATRWKGYAQEEVRQFLDMVTSDLEELTSENNLLKDEAKRLRADLEEHIRREKTLRETMLTAQQMTKEIEEKATKRAEIIIAEAELKGEKVIDAAHRRGAKIAESIIELKRQRVGLESALRATLQSHLSMLDSRTEEIKERDAHDEKLKFLTPKTV